MQLKQGLIHARHHIVFILGLIAAFGTAIKIETWEFKPGTREAVLIERSADRPTTPKPRDLSPEEVIWAEISWKYFENNVQPDTGLVNSVDAYAASTMWDTGSYLLALIAAYKLELIDLVSFDQRMNSALTSLAKIVLFENHLPNKSYNTITLEMVNYQNEATQKGIGWSSIDIGRLMVPFNILVWNFPQHTDAVTKVIERWNFEPMIHDGLMFGAALDEQGNTTFVQEGRIGYEEYGAKSLALAGKDLSKALVYRDFLRFENIYGIGLPTDSRNPEKYNAHNYVVSESYILDGLEFGWDNISREFAYRVYKAQEKRFENTGILTAVSEDNIDQPPHFVYNTVFTDGRSWNAITETGEDASEFKTLSTKAAFGWDALYDNNYTRKLVRQARMLTDGEKGFFSGQYESTGETNEILTANTNAIILESLYYRKFGPMIRMGKSNSNSVKLIVDASTANEVLLQDTVANSPESMDKPADLVNTANRTAKLPQ